MALLRINGVDLPDPAKFEAPTNDLDSEESFRDEDGYLHRDPIRQDIRKIIVGWKGITNSELALIKSSVSPPSFTASWPTELGRVSKTMYASAEKSIILVKYESDAKMWWDIDFSLIEY